MPEGHPDHFMMFVILKFNLDPVRVTRRNQLCSVSPLPSDEVDVMSESSVVFGELLRCSVLAGVLWFGRIGVHHGAEIQQDAQEHGEDHDP